MKSAIFQHTAGKSHLSIALGAEAVRADKSVYFGSLAEIANTMAKAEREGNLAQRVRFLARNSLLVVDEIGYLPIGSNGGNLFFQLVNACYERCAIIPTSNRSFGEWGDVFGDSVVAAALLDRLAPRDRRANRRHIVPPARTRRSAAGPSAQPSIFPEPGAR
ncbi:DNA replication protein [Burkholderia lata]|nr:DNA replication protein [Burkholderia lata]